MSLPNPKHNVNAAEEYFEIALLGHLIAASLHFFKMESMSDTPSSLLSQINKEDKIENKKKIFHSALEAMINKNFNISSFCDDDSASNSDDDKDKDQVRVYTREVISLGIILL